AELIKGDDYHPLHEFIRAHDGRRVLGKQLHVNHVAKDAADGVRTLDRLLVIPVDVVDSRKAAGLPPLVRLLYRALQLVALHGAYSCIDLLESIGEEAVPIKPRRDGLGGVANVE